MDTIEVVTNEENGDVVASVITTVKKGSKDWDKALQWYNYVHGLSEEVWDGE